MNLKLFVRQVIQYLINFAKPLHLDLDGKPLKAQLSKPLAEHMMREGTAAFLERQYNEEQIKIFLDAFEQVDGKFNIL